LNITQVETTYRHLEKFIYLRGSQTARFDAPLLSFA
jgi:hypothetical protein